MGPDSVSVLPGRLARSLRGVGLAGASVAGACAAPAEGWPPPEPVPQGRLAVAVVLGASGSVITDALGSYEVFARSPEFFVYTVSAGPAAVLSGGLAVVPDYLLSDVDAGMAPEPAVVVVPGRGLPGRQERTAAARVAGPPGRPGRAARVLVPEHQQLGILGRLAPVSTIRQPSTQRTAR